MATYTTLKYGSTGDEVKKLQTSLGFTGKDVDGIFGNKTLAAVKDYQQKNNLTVDGIVGKNTWGALNGGSTATTTPTTTTPQQNSTYKYEDFKYDPYEKSDIVKEAEALIEQHKQTNKQSAWTDTLNDTINKILNKEEFSYDLNGDALYQQYKDQYTTQGQLAMMDTMGQAAAMTGGYGNSYAQSVGQQTYQGYLQQLNDKVPELYQIARNQYDQEIQNLKDNASILNNLVQQDNDNYYRELEYLTGRADKLASDEYTQWGDKIGMDYNIHSDRQTAGYQEKQDANTLAMSMLSLGTMPNSELLTTAGISSSDAQAIVNKVKEQEKAANVSSSANSVDKPKSLSVTDTEKIMSNIQAYQENEDKAGLENYLNFLSTTGAISEQQYNSFKQQYLTPEYKETAAVNNFMAKIRTKSEFARGSNSDNTKYKTYNDYVKAMLEKYESDLTDDEIATIAHLYGLK